MRILLVEDDVMIGEELQRSLRKSGYSVDWLQSGLDVDFSLQSEDYSLLILDLGLPNKDGISILKDLRKSKNEIPVLVLTARDGVSDKVMGLDAGADEYMLKPFAMEELEARIRLLLRRRENQHSPLIAVGDISLDPSTHEISVRGKKHILSAKEFSLIRILMGSPAAIFSRAQLEEKIYGWNEEIGSNAVEVLIHQIRKKLGKDIIKNTKGLGYSIGHAE